MPQKKTIIDHFPQFREELQESTRERAAIIGASAIAWIMDSDILSFAFCQYAQLTPDSLRAALVVLSAVGKADQS